MMANNDMSRWCVLYTAPKSERKLVQRLHAAGYMAFCPMQIVFKKWKGQTKEVFAPLFPDCVGTFIKYYKISQLIHTQIIAN